MDAFAGARLMTRVEEADAAIRELLATLLGNRELLLSCLLSGKADFLNECRKSFRGFAVDDSVLEHVWYYLYARRGPGNIAEEFEWLQAQREVREAAQQAEADALKELAEKAKGKDAEAERGKWGTFS